MQQTIKKFSSVLSVIALYGMTLIALAQGVQALLPPPSSTQLVLRYSTPQPVPAVSPAPVISGTPVKLTIPAIDFERAVDDGIYDTARHTWHVSPKGIHYATLSSPANDHAGNTLLYAHNNPSAFGPLKKIKQNDTARITTDNGHTFTYRLVSISDHSPSDTAVFDYRGEPLLTLLTCSGAFNQIRTFYTFRLEDVI